MEVPMKYLSGLIIAEARFSRVPMRGKDNRKGIAVIMEGGFPVSVVKVLEDREGQANGYTNESGKDYVIYYPLSADSAAEVVDELVRMVRVFGAKLA